MTDHHLNFLHLVCCVCRAAPSRDSDDMPPLSCFRARAPCLPGAANPPALRRLQRAQVVTRAAAPRRAERVGRSELPIFPLNLVPFPGSEVPLRIFEVRACARGRWDGARALVRPRRRCGVSGCGA